MTELIGKIKSELKPLTNPDPLNGPGILYRRVQQVHRYILGVKTTWPEKFEIIKFTPEIELQNLDPLLEIIGQYLDCYIIKDSVLKPGMVNPFNTYIIIASREQADLTNWYLKYFYLSIEAILLNKNTELRLGMKMSRLRMRQGKEKRVELEDVRTISSIFRKNIIKEIKELLILSLETMKITDKTAFYRGLSRREDINNRLTAKYGSEWKLKV